MIQTKLALISFIQQLRDDENNLYQYLAYVWNMNPDAFLLVMWDLRKEQKTRQNVGRMNDAVG